MTTFNELGISEDLLKAIQDLKFEKATEIQGKAIPIILEGKDVIAGAKTGSGKTLAFGAGIIHNCTPGKGIQSIVLTPTRELAEQVADNLILFSKYKKLSIAKIYGGVAIDPQIRKLASCDIVIGTPGRVLDHMQRGTLALDKISTLVLDEADRMLDMGFIDDVKRIMQGCPKDKQTLFFSATLPEDIMALAESFMKSPERVNAECFVDPKKLQQEYYDVHEKQKFSLLVHLLKNEDTKLVMVFCNSQRTVDFVEKNLNANGIEAVGLHGKIPQTKRNKILQSFHSNTIHVLCCTDVAARGLDIKGVSHVYNYDIPHDSRQYVHRIGRTARAGKEGKAVNLLCNKDHDNFTRVLRDNDVKIQKMEVPELPRAKVSFTGKNNRRGPPRGRNGGSGGHRGGSRDHRPRRSHSGHGGSRDHSRRHKPEGKDHERIGKAPQFGSD